MKVLRNYLFLKVEEKETKTKSGIVLPDSSKSSPEIGIVVKAGEEVKGIKEGDRVLFKKFAPDEIELEGEKFLSLEEIDILAIL